MPFDPSCAADHPPVIGCDEVGRGALCGPVVVAAVWFDPRFIPADLLGSLDDSKRLPIKERERLSVMVLACARVAFAAASAAHIDRHGIRNVTLQAMRRAIQRLAIDAPARIDGVDVPPGLLGDAMAVIKGDATVPQIAAASVVAKVCRDRLMVRLAQRHPHYAWETNVGYGTARHREALDRHGPTPHHRLSWAPFAQYELAEVAA